MLVANTNTIAAMGLDLGIRAISSASGGICVLGEAQGSSGKGVEGAATAPGGIGVEGVASPVGVRGLVPSPFATAGIRVKGVQGVDSVIPGAIGVVGLSILT